MAKASKPKAKPGRPTLYREGFPEQARKYCLLGATNADLARLFEVAGSTIDKWIAEIPEFSGAVKAGREEADAKVAASLFHRAVGYQHEAVKIFMPAGADAPVYAPYTEHYAPDTAAAFIWLKNRRPDVWRDKTETTTNHKLVDENDAPVTPLELARKVAFLLTAGVQQPEEPKPLH